jgi:hypothetical protein
MALSLTNPVRLDLPLSRDKYAKHSDNAAASQVGIIRRGHCTVLTILFYQSLNPIELAVSC